MGRRQGIVIRSFAALLFLAASPFDLKGQQYARAISSPEEAAALAPRIFESIFKDIPLSAAAREKGLTAYRTGLVEATKVRFGKSAESCEKLREVYRIGVRRDSVLESIVPRAYRALFEGRMANRRPMRPSTINPSCPDQPEKTDPA